MINEPNVTNRQSLDRLSCSFDKQELRRFLTIIQERLDSAAELEIRGIQRTNQTDDEQFENIKNLIRSGFKIRPTLTGRNGSELYGSSDEVFDSPNFPDVVMSFYMNSEIFLKATENYTVRNSLEMFLDFSRPEVFDFTLMPSDRTPNGSNIKVRGSDPTWVNGVFHEAHEFIKTHQSPAPWLHRHSIYDILLWFVGFPVAFCACYKVSPLLSSLPTAGSFQIAALFFYIFLITLFGFRALFHYSRWVFPFMEYRHQNDNTLRHRITLGALLLGLSSSIIYDILKKMLMN